MSLLASKEVNPNLAPGQVQVKLPVRLASLFSSIQKCGLGELTANKFELFDMLLQLLNAQIAS